MEIVVIFIIGLIFGSFLNVVIYRLKSGDPIGFSRSFCVRCKTILKWRDLVPILSFMELGGCCRYCRKKIPWQYPIVEVLSGFIWVGVFWKIFGFQPLFVTTLNKGGLGGIFDISFLNFFYHIFILSSLLVIAVYDFKWKIIPNKIIYPSIVISLFYNIFDTLMHRNTEVFLYYIFAASAAFLFFFLMYFFSKGKAMGLGDAKLAFLIDLFLKPFLALIAFNLAFVLGAVYGIILIVAGKKTLKSKIAFGPFMVLGVAIVFLLSDFINNFFIF